MALSQVERNERTRENKKKQGLVRKEFWIRPKHFSWFKSKEKESQVNALSEAQEKR